MTRQMPVPMLDRRQLLCRCLELVGKLSKRVCAGKWVVRLPNEHVG